MSVTSDNSVNGAYPDLQNDSHSTGASSTKNPKNLGNNGSLDLPGKIENFKAWSSTAMKCTKQVIEEKLGTTSPTRDPEMDGKIDEVKRIQAKYQEISTMVKKMITHMNAITALEQSLSSQLTVASQHQPELINEFAQNAEVQRVVAISTNSYIGALELFCDGLDTFCKKTVPDTLATIRQLEHARLVYDAHRNDLARLEAKASGKAISTGNSTPQPAFGETPSEDLSSTTAALQLELNVQQMRQKFAAQKEIYLTLKKDTDMKMKLLHENRTRVMRKHLGAVQAATLSYYANGFSALNEALKALMEQQYATPSDLQNHQETSFLEVESPSPYTKAPETSNQHSPTQQQKPTYFAMTENGLEGSGNNYYERDVFND